MTQALDSESFINLSENWWDLPDTDRQILRILKKFYDKTPNPRIQPKREWLAEKIGLKVCAISRSLSRLRKEGWVTTVFRGRKGNRYELPEWMRKLDFKRPDKWFDMDMETAEEVFKTEKKPEEKSLFEVVKDTVKATVKATISGEYTFLPNEPYRLSNTGSLRGSGSVHVAPLREQSHDPHLGFFNMINLEERSSLDVANIWRGFKFDDGTTATDFDMKCWLKKHGPLATHGALIAYRYEIERRAARGTTTRVPGVRFVQHILDKEKWKGMLTSAKNHDTAMQHLVGASKAFYRVNYSSAYTTQGSEAIELVIPPEAFERIIRNECGIEPKQRKNTFNKYIPQH